MMHRVNYNGFEMESKSAWEWRAIDKRVSFEADYLNTQINANRVDMGSVHVTPAMAMAEIEGLEWITKMPEEDSGDALFGAEVKAYDPNQKRGEAGTPDGGRWVKEDGTSSETEALSKLKEENKSTWPKIRVEKIYKNENASRSGELDMKTKMLADEYLEGDRFKELEEVGVDPKNIYPTQRNLTASNLEDVSDVSKETGAFALKKDGKFFILDGHHRVAANILRGDKPIIHVLDLDI